MLFCPNSSLKMLARQGRPIGGGSSSRQTLRNRSSGFCGTKGAVRTIAWFGAGSGDAYLLVPTNHMNRPLGFPRTQTGAQAVSAMPLSHATRAKPLSGNRVHGLKLSHVFEDNGATCQVFAKKRYELV